MTFTCRSYYKYSTVTISCYNYSSVTISYYNYSSVTAADLLPQPGQPLPGSSWPRPSSGTNCVEDTC